jgi:hypothetical protein
MLSSNYSCSTSGIMWLGKVLEAVDRGPGGGCSLINTNGGIDIMM